MMTNVLQSMRTIKKKKISKPIKPQKIDIVITPPLEEDVVETCRKMKAEITQMQNLLTQEIENDLEDLHIEEDEEIMIKRTQSINDLREKRDGILKRTDSLPTIPENKKVVTYLNPLPSREEKLRSLSQNMQTGKTRKENSERRRKMRTSTIQ